jgi:hypothetical protein
MLGFTIEKTLLSERGKGRMKSTVRETGVVQLALLAYTDGMPVQDSGPPPICENNMSTFRHDRIFATLFEATEAEQSALLKALAQARDIAINWV